jgi:hypothetical protein
MQLIEPLVHARDEFFLSTGSHRVVLLREKRVGRVEAEQRHGLKTLPPQVGAENAVVGQGVAIELLLRENLDDFRRE